MYNLKEREKNDYSSEIEEDSHKHEPLDEEPDPTTGATRAVSTSSIFFYLKRGMARNREVIPTNYVNILVK